MPNPLAITAIANAGPTAPLLLRGDLVQAVSEAAALGYDALEIHVIDADDFPLDLLKEACAEYGVRISAVVTGQIFTRRHRCITSPDLENRNAAMAELKTYIDLSAALGATDGVVIGWVKGTRPENREQDFDDLLASQLRVLAQSAAQQGQRLLVEVINRYETNVFNTARELADFLDRYELSNVYLHLDTFHMNIEEADLAQAIHTAGKRLGYFHVADSNRRYLGSGHLDFEIIFQALQAVGYTGTISVECLPQPDSITAGAKSKAFLDRFFQGRN